MYLGIDYGHPSRYLVELGVYLVEKRITHPFLYNEQLFMSLKLDFEVH